MKYIAFEVENFRGIKKARVDLDPAGAGVFTLIGLNESGKTTVLEAISTFHIQGGDEKSLYQLNPSEIDPASFVPKDEKATFTGEIAVSAHVQLAQGDRQHAANWAEKQSGAKVDASKFPDQFIIRRGYKFENGDQIAKLNDWNISILVKDKGARAFKAASKDHKAWVAFTAMMNVLMPEIVYFPKFLFALPSKIVLNPAEKELASDRLYRNIITNVGLALEKPIDVKSAIVDRILKPETAGDVFLGLFSLSNNRQQQIDAAINQLSHNLSTTVLDSWSRIFTSAPGDREIRFKLGVDQHDDGSPRVYVQFTVRDGTQTYDIDERSTGFKWFFSFLLFTLYRGRPNSSRKTLFLLDEPASNLHAGAQSQLLESFPKIANKGSQMIYSTHSHYLINPTWLDQAFIISNAAMNYDDLSEKRLPASKHTSISVQRYRQFVGTNPDKTTYFQPVLDRLQVVPSRLDMLIPSVVVEGKGDYLILSYGLFVSGRDQKYVVMPTRGADHFDELIGILLGWGVNFALCCDDDAPGRKAVDDYRDNWGIQAARVFTLASFSDSLKGKKIEHFLSHEDLKLISDHFHVAGSPTKGQIQLFFSEHLALKKRIELSKEFTERLAAFDDQVRAALGLEQFSKKPTTKQKVK